MSHPHWFNVLIWLASLALIAMTLLPLAQTPAWWVRAFDFPRAQIAGFLAIVLLAGVLALDPGSGATWLLIMALTASLVYQVVRIFPFTPLAPVQATTVERCAPSARIRLLIANVLESNRDSRPLLEISGLLDPRIGRGLYSTFNANWPLLRWPLDHVFFHETLELIDMRRMGPIGSDHFPIYIALCHQPEATARQSAPQPDAEDEQDADEAIDEGREQSEP